MELYRTVHRLEAVVALKNAGELNCEDEHGEKEDGKEPTP